MTKIASSSSSKRTSTASSKRTSTASSNRDKEKLWLGINDGFGNPIYVTRKGNGYTEDKDNKSGIPNMARMVTDGPVPTLSVGKGGKRTKKSTTQIKKSRRRRRTRRTMRTMRTRRTRRTRRTMRRRLDK
tara:strand:+ start:252 stop:641 length:390 start_codon:yes stop_codon:yes gene_type:complete